MKFIGTESEFLTFVFFFVIRFFYEEDKLYKSATG